ncbi:hypothetical protein WV34_03580 [Bacillus amyloliquefaciens]|uniref:hypothetical protein n=1 Tax=Bacillaceae TaxID=186817 RepID=UPI000B51CC66|nr:MULTISPECIES: hypothetical protein [Bacillus amyloliquefaciens group]ASF27903.1 hypothetical protein WV34_03580 [Bacillus amyloliquefaciens]
MSNYIANVENYVELEEKLVELDMSNEHEKIIREAIDYSNDNLREDGNATFTITRRHSQKDISYDFVFQLFVVEEKDDRYLYYETCIED